MPGISRDSDTAGGDLVPSQSTVFANNQLVIIDGDTVQSHGRSPHGTQTIIAKNNNVYVANKLVANSGDVASNCNEAASGSTNVVVGDGPSTALVVPTLVIPDEVQATFDLQTNNYVANPGSFVVESNDQIKRNFAGTPEQPDSIGVGLIDTGPTAAAAADIAGFLTQILAEAAKGQWDETGMGGNPSNPNIVGIWRELGYPAKGAWTTDQTAWCMGFVNWCLKKTKYRFIQTAWAYHIRDRAREYKATQIPLDQGQPGDIALWSYGHVNFVYSASGGRLTFVGGNQSSSARNNNNPSSGSVTRSWPGGYRPPGDGSLIGLWRPSRE
jgi:uncharacterized protein (TIGR02594 family)